MKTQLILINFLIPLFCFGQSVFLSNQTLISIKDQSFLSVRGDVVSTTTNASFHNTDTILVLGDWENYSSANLMMNPSGGVIKLNGLNQTVKGSFTTNFYDLRLENTGIAYLRQVDAEVLGFLHCNDREFNVDSQTVYILNPQINAVQTGLNNQYGFISSSEKGGISRMVDQNAAYLFPVGSSQNFSRFRPIEIEPQNNQPDQFKVSFVNDDPSNFGLDRSLKDFEICTVNPLYFHMIENQNQSQADLYFYTDTIADGDFDGFSQWKNLQWNLKSNLSTAPAKFGLSAYRVDSTVHDYFSENFALVVQSPALTMQAIPNPICENQEVLLTAIGNYNDISFIIDSITYPALSQGTLSLFLTPGIHQILAMGVNGNCGRYSDTVQLRVWETPDILNSDDTIIVQGTVANLYSNGGDFYDWIPATDLTCSSCANTLANPIQTTEYIVRVENVSGCFAYDTLIVDVRPDVKSIIVIPNVITPNGDGFNDTWRITNVNLFPKNKLIIVNRWGDIVFQSEYYNNDWEGRFGNGYLPDGTYYYILDLGEGWGIFKGDVTIIRE
jgi:gliding motility-associated-like protein